MTHSLSKSHVIIVDDESINLTIMELSLQERECKVTTFPSGEKCLEAIAQNNLKNYDCLVTDYSMPGMSGIELLKQVKKLDPTLEVILITGEHERKIIQESLRMGAFDFLDKPINLEKFYGAVEKAVLGTSNRRKRSATEKSLLAARSTGLFNSIKSQEWKSKFDLIYSPKHELGGDFIDVYESKEQDRQVIFGDVSGHDIQSALLSAHFMGTLSGRRSIEEKVNAGALFSSYNSLLLERGSRLHAATSFEFGSSLSICALEFSNTTPTVEITNCGVPDIYLIKKDGSVARIPPGYQPLGWFEIPEYPASKHEIDDVHTIFGFTDGLVEFAHKRQWDVLSLVQHINSLAKDQRDQFLNTADDDVLMLKISFKEDPLESIPIINDSYRGNETYKIDRFQNQWKQSLKLSIPEASPKKLDRFLLACREAVLNGQKHGCEHRADSHAKFTVTWNPQTKILRAIVEDPGEGHSFDPEQRDHELAELTPGHLGLVLISKLVDQVQSSSNGSTIEMQMAICE